VIRSGDVVGEGIERRTSRNLARDHSKLFKLPTAVMPTGIEEAGLVLAVFPILCSLIQQYLVGLESINSFIRYRHDLEVLLFKLNAEHRLFKTSCFLLLSPVGDLRVINSLIEDPGGQHWRDQELMKAVIQDLGEEVWEECVKFIHMMQGIMRKIQDVLEKNLGSKVEAKSFQDICGGANSTTDPNQRYHEIASSNPSLVASNQLQL
jgi:hypothetical protein